MKNRLWRQRSGDRATTSGSRQDSQESTVSTSSSIREFELFQQFCSNTSPDWVNTRAFVDCGEFVCAADLPDSVVFCDTVRGFKRKLKTRLTELATN